LNIAEHSNMTLKKNRLDLYQLQKCLNVIMLLIILLLSMTSINALATLPEPFFSTFCQQTHTRTQRHCFTPAMHETWYNFNAWCPWNKLWEETCLQQHTIKQPKIVCWP